MLGAAAGALIGGVIGDIVDQAVIEAAREDAPVAFQRVTPEGRVERVEAAPIVIARLDRAIHRKEPPGFPPSRE